MTMPLNEARVHLAKEVARSARDGDGSLLEADAAVNDANRAVVAAMREQHGQAWLGDINRGKDERGGPVMWEWDGDLVYNFGAAYVLPARDAELECLVLEREAAAYQGTAADWKRLQPILARVHAAGGVLLVWT